MVRYPHAKDPTRTKIMKSNRGKNTKPEMRLRGTLIRAGLSGFKLHWSDVPGSPDIAFPQEKLAIFVNGCFWHRCPTCKPKLPITNRDFWRKKFENNHERDESKIAALQEIGWRVLVIWECEIKNNLSLSRTRVIDAIQEYKGHE